MQKASLCGLGQTAPNPVLSTLRYFRDEYLAHILDQKCPAGKCKDLVRSILPDKCIGCGLCARKCPVNCISGRRRTSRTSSTFQVHQVRRVLQVLQIQRRPQELNKEE
jgi:ferredoxin